jgi:hypothetical protein
VSPAELMRKAEPWNWTQNGSAEGARVGPFLHLQHRKQPVSNFLPPNGATVKEYSYFKGVYVIKYVSNKVSFNANKLSNLSIVCGFLVRRF